MSISCAEHVVRVLRQQNIPIKAGTVAKTRDNVQVIKKFFGVTTSSLHRVISKDDRAFQTIVVFPYRRQITEMVYVILHISIDFLLFVSANTNISRVFGISGQH